MVKERVIILGAAGRDFHNFNVVYRNNPNYEVVAFTATQIPNISGRMYPKELSGKLYPKGIPIFPESDIVEIIKKFHVNVAVFSYSDISYEDLMQKGARVNSAGADFLLLGYKKTFLKSKKPVIAITAVRTGSGKSQVSRKIARILKEKGSKVSVIRHPMPYGNLAEQIVQKFEKFSDLDKYKCTIEEREEYEPYIEQGMSIFSGTDYAQILETAEKNADILIWDGGNNDLPFYKPDLHFCVLDPHRAGDELNYYPGQTNFLMADVLIVNKMNTAEQNQIDVVFQNIQKLRNDALVIRSNSVISVENSDKIANKNVLVVEDGPSVTHGGMKFGAGLIAAKMFKASAIIDPRPYAVGSIKQTFQKFPHIETVLPAMGYGLDQIEELEKTINKSNADTVILGTPIDLGKLLVLDKPSVRVTYDIEEIGKPNLYDVLEGFLKAQRASAV